MTFNSNQFKLRWRDSEGKDRSKVYSDYDQAKKAFKWLNDNGADADLAIIKRIKRSEGGEDSESSMFPSK